MGRKILPISGDSPEDRNYPGSVLTLDTVRLMAQPMGGEEGLIPSLSWVITVDDLRYEETVSGWVTCTVLGDLSIMSRHWGVYTTSRIVFRFPDGRLNPGSAPVIGTYLRGMVALHAPWAAHLLWQQATVAARTTAALCQPAYEDRIQIPYDMPGTTLSITDEIVDAVIRSAGGE